MAGWIDPASLTQYTTVLCADVFFSVEDALLAHPSICAEWVKQLNANRIQVQTCEAYFRPLGEPVEAGDSRLEHHTHPHVLVQALGYQELDAPVPEAIRAAFTDEDREVLGDGLDIDDLLGIGGTSGD